MTDYKKLLLPIALLIALGIAFFFAGRYFFDQITKLNSQIKQAKDEQAVLQRKIAVLEQNQTSVNSFTDRVVLALPSDNPVLAAISQVKLAANDGGATINNLSGGQVTKKDDLNQVSVAFDLETDVNNGFAIINEIFNSAPLSAISKLSLTSSSENPRFSLVFNYYWSPLPTELPNIVSESKELTPEEQGVLNTISSMKFVNFDQEPAPLIRGDQPDRANPFE
jgi:hypothetical protein